VCMVSHSEALCNDYFGTSWNAVTSNFWHFHALAAVAVASPIIVSSYTCAYKMSEDTICLLNIAIQQISATMLQCLD